MTYVHGEKEYESREDYIQKLNYDISNLCYLTSCQLIELVPLLSDHNIYDSAFTIEFINDSKFVNEVKSPVICNHEYLHFFINAIKAGDISLKKEGIRTDYLDAYIDPQNCIKVFLEKYQDRYYPLFVDVENLKKLAGIKGEEKGSDHKFYSAEKKLLSMANLPKNTQVQTRALRLAANQLIKAGHNEPFLANCVLKYIQENLSDFEGIIKCSPRKGIFYSNYLSELDGRERHQNRQAVNRALKKMHKEYLEAAK